MNLTCPCCHASTSIEAFIQDESARLMLAMRGQLDPQVWPQLIPYLGLFRSAARALAWGRALRLAQEVAAINADPTSLTVALFETVEAMRAKRDKGDVRPLKNHNYLKQVLSSVDTTAMAPVASSLTPHASQPAPRRLTKIDQAEQLLATWAGDNQLHQIIGHGLTALLAIPLAKAPEAAAIDRTASLWARDLGKHGLTAADSSRVEIAFDRLLSRVKDWFPVADDLFEYLPRSEKPETKALPEPADNPAGIARAKEFFNQIGASVSLPKTGEDEEARRRLLSEQASQIKGEG